MHVLVYRCQTQRDGRSKSYIRLEHGRPDGLALLISRSCVRRERVPIAILFVSVEIRVPAVVGRARGEYGPRPYGMLKILQTHGPV